MMAEAYNADRMNFKRSVRTRTQLEAAEKFKERVLSLLVVRLSGKNSPYLRLLVTTRHRLW